MMVVDNSLLGHLNQPATSYRRNYVCFLMRIYLYANLDEFPFPRRSHIAPGINTLPPS